MSSDKRSVLDLLAAFSIPLLAGVVVALVAANLFQDWYQLPIPSEATPITIDGITSVRYPSDINAPMEGWYRAYFKDDDYAEGSPAANGIVLLRSYAKATGGGPRLIEVEIEESQ